MIPKNLINIIISSVALLAIIAIAIKFCGTNDKLYTQKEIDAKESEYKAKEQRQKDTLEFIKGQLDLQEGKSIAQTDRVINLEKEIDALIRKHEKTKEKINSGLKLDSAYAILVPNDYVDECETCFNKIKQYKYENTSLRFERDAYDTLMREQNEINERRIETLEFNKGMYVKFYEDCEKELHKKSNPITRKLKLSAAGVLNNLFMPNGGGPGLIYEDRKSNEFGGHILFTTKSQPMYMIHIAKTISLRRKK